MSVVDTASQLGSTLSEIAGRMSDGSRAAGRAIEDRRSDTAATLHGAAGALRTAADQVRERMDELVDSVVDKLETAASYIEGRNGRRSSSGTQLLVAGGIAFLVGFAMWRLTRTSAPIGRQ